MDQKDMVEELGKAFAEPVKDKVSGFLQQASNLCMLIGEPDTATYIMAALAKVNEDTPLPQKLAEEFDRLGLPHTNKVLTNEESVAELGRLLAKGTIDQEEHDRMVDVFK